MPAREIIESPHRYKERILVYGGAGTGKSSVTCNIARYMPDDVTMHVLDLDYSMAYERLLAMEYLDVWDRGTVQVHAVDAVWEDFEAKFKELIDTADPTKDWITVDPATVTWQMVQAWWSKTVHGENIADHMAELRKSAADLKEYNAMMANDMTWPAINKQYQEKFYRMIHKWRGHIILVCEPDTIRKDADADERSTYGYVGYKPQGQKTLPHVAATNIFFDHPDRAKWRFTTVKDRGRKLVEKQPITEFAQDYLVEIGGWESRMVME